jgi:hypothetical protein
VVTHVPFVLLLVAGLLLLGPWRHCGWAAHRR